MGVQFDPTESYYFYTTPTELRLIAEALEEAWHRGESLKIDTKRNIVIAIDEEIMPTKISKGGAA